jgi:ATP-dependent Lon protease
MEVINLPGYTEEEKVQIGRNFLFPKQIREHGLKPEQISISDNTIKALIREYTREAGVRNLERSIATLCRKAAREIVQGRAKEVRITSRNLDTFLGPPRYRFGLAEKTDEVGVATGLAWTEVGGDVLSVEVSIMRGKGNLMLTGHLGDVMRESAQAGYTYIRSRAGELGIPEDFHEKQDVHIHVPEGAIPKDGPSAGITMATALASALSGRPVRREVAMTGEITLRGRVLPVGGVKEKVLAAHRAGVKTVILPEENRKDLEEIPRHVRRRLRFVFVKNMDEVLQEALLPAAQKPPAETGEAQSPRGVATA